MSTKKEDLQADVKRITNDLRIAQSLMELKRDQAERAEERVGDLTKQLGKKLGELSSTAPPHDEAAAAGVVAAG